MTLLAQKPSRTRWYILALLFFITTNNYLDRILLGILSPVIMEDLGMDTVAYGYVNSAFQFAYAIGFLAMGKFIDRVGTRVGYSFAILFWSVAAALHAASRSALSLAFFRGVLGLGEAGNFPAAIKAVAEWFPKKDRAFATGIFNAGTNVATMIGPPLFVWMNAHLGWRNCFLITASTGAIVLVLCWLHYRPPHEHKWVNAAELAYIQSEPEERSTAQIGWLAALRSYPASVRLEDLAYRMAIIGFVFWSFTLIAGSIWAERAWSRYWGWDTKEVRTLVIWVLYAGFIHARATRGWRGTRSAWLSVVAYSAIIFNYTVVNVFIPGLHSYSGLV